MVLDPGRHQSANPILDLTFKFKVGIRYWLLFWNVFFFFKRLWIKEGIFARAANSDAEGLDSVTSTRSGIDTWGESRHWNVGRKKILWAECEVLFSQDSLWRTITEEEEEQEEEEVLDRHSSSVQKPDWLNVNVASRLVHSSLYFNTMARTSNTAGLNK